MDFQTPPVVAKYMASLMPDHCGTILEPTPGSGNLVRAVTGKGEITAPGNFENLPRDSRYDWAIMNPPFTPMKEGYRYLKAVMEMSDNIIALLPWFILINSDKRIREIKSFGMVSVTSLPRKAFPSSRIQTCILHLRKGYEGETLFTIFDWTKTGEQPGSLRLPNVAL